MNPLNPNRVHAENPMPFVTSTRMSSRQTETILNADGDRFVASRFGTVTDEVVVVDDRSDLRPSQAVENRLVALLRESSLPVSHLQVRGFVRGRRDD